MTSARSSLIFAINYYFSQMRAFARFGADAFALPSTKYIQKTHAYTTRREFTKAGLTLPVEDEQRQARAARAPLTFLRDSTRVRSTLLSRHPISLPLRTRPADVKISRLQPSDGRADGYSWPTRGAVYISLGAAARCAKGKSRPATSRVARCDEGILHRVARALL